MQILGGVGGKIQHPDGRRMTMGGLWNRSNFACPVKF